jgi:hypothetical protein
MELASRKPCIISVGVGGAYPFGVDRLERSLIHHGWAGRTMFWKDYPVGCPLHAGPGQYAFKIYSFLEAFRLGHRVVLWCDSSLYAIKDVMPVFDYIADNGLFLFKSGYSLSATATDRMLEAAEEEREDLVDVPEFATGCVGIDIDSEKGETFFQQWMLMMEQGFFGGNRILDAKDSTHPLFQFSRQDQSAASMVLHKMGITEAGHDKRWVSYYPQEEESTIFFVKGL